MSLPILMTPPGPARRWPLAAILLFSACGDGDPTPPVDAAGGGVRLPIAFEVSGSTPLLLAVRDDDPDAAWTVLPTSATGEYATQATRRHQIAMVCGGPTSFTTFIEMRVRSDPAPFLFCGGASTTPATRFPITGEMLQPGQVSITSADASPTAPWTFELTATAGAHDLVAFGESLALVRPGLAITGATTLPAIDLAQDGAAYETTTVVVTNRELDETLQTELTVFIANDIAEYTRTGVVARALPAALVGGGFQFSAIAAHTPGTRRSVEVQGAGTINVTLPPRLADITFADLGVAWPTLPPATASVRYAVHTATNVVVVEASGTYLDGDTALSAELDITGFDPAWRVPADGRRHRLSVYDESYAESSVYSPPNAAIARAFDEPGRPSLATRRRIAAHASGPRE